MLKLLCFIAIIAYGIFMAVCEWKFKNQIFQLKEKMKDLERCRGEMEKIFTTSDNSPLILENQVSELNLRADNLKFCYLCPLYQDKVREDMTKELDRTQRKGVREVNQEQKNKLVKLLLDYVEEITKRETTTEAEVQVLPRIVRVLARL